MITLSDLETDLMNVRQCCNKLNQVRIYLNLCSRVILSRCLLYFLDISTGSYTTHDINCLFHIQ